MYRETPDKVSSSLFPGLSLSRRAQDANPAACEQSVAEASFVLTWQPETSMLPDFKKSCRGVTLSLSGEEASLTVPVSSRELRFYFENYKDYYYLPGEDEAIHKSVAAYVDKAFRKKATARTCYIRRSGAFVPVFSPPDDTPLFRESYSSKELFILPEEDFFSDMDALSLFLCSWLEAFI